MSTSPAPFVDHAAPVLQNEPITDEQRADLWDTFNQSKDPAELQQKLQGVLAVPDDTKKKLLQAKQTSMPAPGPLDKVTAAIDQLAQLDPQKREIAESHPNLLKAFTSAAATTAKGVKSASGDVSAAPKGKEEADGQTPAPSALQPLPPRPDGLPHLPPIPAGFKRILASDGGIHDLPADDQHIQDAFKRDPKLRVLNP